MRPSQRVHPSVMCLCLRWRAHGLFGGAEHPDKHAAHSVVVSHTTHTHTHSRAVADFSGCINSNFSQIGFAERVMCGEQQRRGHIDGRMSVCVRVCVQRSPRGTFGIHRLSTARPPTPRLTQTEPTARSDRQRGSECVFENSLSM